MRLIDADVLKIDYLYPTTTTGTNCIQYVSKIQIDNAPTVEPKHGHWDNKIIDSRFAFPHTVARCSNCKGKLWVYVEYYVVKYPYCPMCGAKMDEVIDETDKC